jgi:hypothetical protein
MKRRRSSTAEHSFQGIATSRLRPHAKSVTHVSGTFCHLCLGSLINEAAIVAALLFVHAHEAELEAEAERALPGPL